METKAEELETADHLRRTEDDERSNDNRCSFVISGFGPFAGVPNNPTSSLITLLQNNKAQLLDDGIHIRETHILDTSASCARTELEGIYSRLCRDSLKNDNRDDKNDACSKKDVVVCVHLGVNYRGTQMQLEQCAYNDATFRVPDNNGYQPQQISILGDSSSFGSCLRTTLELDEICSELRQQGQSYCCVSQDPGRFVCNYTYCLSLDHSQSMNDDIKTNKQLHTQQFVGSHSLFLHVTPFDVIPEDKQLGFIISLLKCINKNVSQKLTED